MLLTEQQIGIRNMAREFARREIVPFAARWDRDHEVPIATIAKMFEVGLMGVCVPPAWGGAGADFVSYVLAMEQIAYGDAGVANIMAANNSPVAAAILAFGNDDQKERFLGPIVSGGAMAAFLLSEPGAGSDAAAICTRARRERDGFVIDGAKCFVTSGASADIAMIFAVTDPGAGKAGVTCFLARTKTDGYVVVRRERKLGHRSNDTCQIALESLRVSTSDILGKPGEGLKIALSALDTGRIGVAAQSVGVGQAAFDAALSYARQRKTFGKAIIDHQAVGFMLAEMATRLEAARQLYLHAAVLKGAGHECIMEASMAKLFAAEAAEFVTSSAIQVHGGYGYLKDFPVEKFYRDQRVFQIYDGTNEVQKMLIARELKKK
ncbi:acyl-CoA dehydrogenase family protein [Bradyrhizobium sp. dw_411]|uniref:acyl-CoA dehydrogenase family protein n=1 Tax=Bradyrhizobium sp. dw_411 TaxID=2720082 RepID=UPI001BCF60D2|nr:acyl-CoA dehydrogenase family protein [Bradyrhizobium sp. dw_411]